MPNTKPRRTGHVTTGDIFDDLGFSPQETLEAKIKADLWRALVSQLERSGWSQAEMAQRLNAHQPDISHLMKGKISRFSVTKLIQWAGRMGLEVRIAVKRSKSVDRMAA